jgi:hypothetical protein
LCDGSIHPLCPCGLQRDRELGIDKPCPTNVWFLIKNLIKVGLQKNRPVKVRLNLKILTMLGYPKKFYKMAIIESIAASGD